MPDNAPSLMSLYKGWDVYQQHLVTAIQPLSSEQLALRAAPDLRTVERIAAHIIGARTRWFQDLMGEGGAEIAALKTWDRRGAPPRTAAELVHGLEASWQVIQQCLERWALADLEFGYPGDPADGEPEVLTRQWVIWHVLEHDLHHGGELSFSLGMYNVAAIDL